MLNNFIDARQFTFAPFPHPSHEGGTGDSGALQLATSKTDPGLQYIVKNGFPELGCNEFMYHKVAAAVGLNAQEVRLFINRQYQQAAAIRYVPGARENDLSTATPENRAAFYGFEALFFILNEDDSHEYYLDGTGRLFKLDNAASFKLNEASLDLLRVGLFNGAIQPETDRYEPMRQALVRNYGDEASEPYLDVFRRFAALDMAVFDEALDALCRNYSASVAGYFHEFLQERIKACGTYVEGLI